MKLMNKIVSVVASAALAAMLLAGCGASASSAAASSEAASSSEAAVSSEAASSTAEDAAGDSAAKVHATFTVTDAEGKSSSIDLEVTDGEKLSDALVAAGVISQDEADAGFVTTVNGEKADYDADGTWWCLTDGSGEMTSVGVADIELHDGDSYAFTYTK